ncbi:hypothetical protein [uncultured Psychrobacter sp.]|uniref:hypothetical protein n=1 Tax=uncultured Psychrobacter sp. TaxID=259303 RepID=UPI0034592724
MMLPKNIYAFVVITVLASGVASCHSTPIQSSQPLSIVETPAINTLAAIKDIEVKDDQVIQWANGYNWQLQQVIVTQGNAINVPAVSPITIEAVPDKIILTESCQRYSFSSLKILAPPFPNYGFGDLQVESICADNSLGEITNANSSNDNNNSNDNGSMIKELFAQLTSYNYNLKLLPLAQSQFQTTTNAAPKRLALNFENGASLVFVGASKNLLKPTGLPITNELLERYQWRLVSGTSNNYNDDGQLISRTPINNFYYPDIPVLLSFSADRDQYASFYADCNQGIGGPYALLKDHTLLIGSGVQTVMGCGFKGDRVENTITDLMARSKSKLTLSLQPAKAKSETPADFPRYNLLQTMETGETLVWQNETKTIR